jgi:hypothetical protein
MDYARTEKVKRADISIPNSWGMGTIRRKLHVCNLQVLEDLASP